MTIRSLEENDIVFGWKVRSIEPTPAGDVEIVMSRRGYPFVTVRMKQGVFDGPLVMVHKALVERLKYARSIKGDDN